MKKLSEFRQAIYDNDGEKVKEMIGLVTALDRRKDICGALAFAVKGNSYDPFDVIIESNDSRFVNEIEVSEAFLEAAKMGDCCALDKLIDIDKMNLEQSGRLALLLAARNNATYALKLLYKNSVIRRSLTEEHKEVMLDTFLNN